ncbi:MAG: trpF, partial [Verrucomicrobiales bacterium]|nr:trpF [Verrucomicrobiales bacterium]
RPAASSRPAPPSPSLRVSMFPFPQPPHPLTKICGITTLADARLCADAGADAIGINFYPKSKRFHPFEKAALWLADLPPTLTRVAVLVNAPDEEVQRLATSGLIDVLQFHGDESPETVRAARRFGLPIIKALPLLPTTTAAELAAWPADALLLDAHAPGTYGGTGHTIDWTRAAEIIQSLAPFPVLLSGGLTALNIATAIQQTQPAGVDTASGVESAPGIKDPDKVRAFISGARPA